VVGTDSLLVIFQHRVQRNTGLVLGTTPFFRVVREIAEELWPKEDYQWQSIAVEALQEAAEIYLFYNFEG
jgi:histone H3/H4